MRIYQVAPPPSLSMSQSSQQRRVDNNPAAVAVVTRAANAAMVSNSGTFRRKCNNKVPAAVQQLQPPSTKHHYDSDVDTDDDDGEDEEEDNEYDSQAVLVSDEGRGRMESNSVGIHHQRLIAIRSPRPQQGRDSSPSRRLVPAVIVAQQQHHEPQHRHKRRPLLTVPSPMSSKPKPLSLSLPLQVTAFATTTKTTTPTTTIIKTSNDPAAPAVDWRNRKPHHHGNNSNSNKAPRISKIEASSSYLAAATAAAAVSLEPTIMVPESHDLSQSTDASSSDDDGDDRIHHNQPDQDDLDHPEDLLPLMAHQILDDDDDDRSKDEDAGTWTMSSNQDRLLLPQHPHHLQQKYGHGTESEEGVGSPVDRVESDRNQESYQQLASSTTVTTQPHRCHRNNKNARVAALADATTAIGALIPDFPLSTDRLQLSPSTATTNAASTSLTAPVLDPEEIQAWALGGSGSRGPSAPIQSGSEDKEYPNECSDAPAHSNTCNKSSRHSASVMTTGAVPPPVTAGRHHYSKTLLASARQSRSPPTTTARPALRVVSPVGAGMPHTKSPSALSSSAPQKLRPSPRDAPARRSSSYGRHGLLRSWMMTSSVTAAKPFGVIRDKPGGDNSHTHCLPSSSSPLSPRLSNEAIATAAASASVTPSIGGEHDHYHRHSPMTHQMVSPCSSPISIDSAASTVPRTLPNVAWDNVNENTQQQQEQFQGRFDQHSNNHNHHHVIDDSAVATNMAEPVPVGYISCIQAAFGSGGGDSNNSCQEDDQDDHDNDQLDPNAKTTTPASKIVDFVEVDLYQTVLQVPRTADDRKLRIAYFRQGRRMLAQAGPSSVSNAAVSASSASPSSSMGGCNMSSSTDTIPADTKQRFQAVSMAFEIVTHPIWKAVYDEYGLTGLHRWSALIELQRKQQQQQHQQVQSLKQPSAANAVASSPPQTEDDDTAAHLEGAEESDVDQEEEYDDDNHRYNDDEDAVLSITSGPSCSSLTSVLREGRYSTFSGRSTTKQQHQQQRASSSSHSTTAARRGIRWNEQVEELVYQQHLEEALFKMAKAPPSQQVEDNDDGEGDDDAIPEGDHEDDDEDDNVDDEDNDEDTSTTSSSSSSCRSNQDAMMIMPSGSSGSLDIHVKDIDGVVMRSSHKKIIRSNRGSSKGPAALHNRNGTIRKLLHHRQEQCQHQPAAADSLHPSSDSEGVTRDVSTTSATPSSSSTTESVRFVSVEGAARPFSPLVAVTWDTVELHMEDFGACVQDFLLSSNSSVTELSSSPNRDSKMLDPQPSSPCNDMNMESLARDVPESRDAKFVAVVPNTGQEQPMATKSAIVQHDDRLANEEREMQDVELTQKDVRNKEMGKAGTAAKGDKRTSKSIQKQNDASVQQLFKTLTKPIPKDSVKAKSAMRLLRHNKDSNGPDRELQLPPSRMLSATKRSLKLSDPKYDLDAATEGNPDDPSPEAVCLLQHGCRDHVLDETMSFSSVNGAAPSEHANPPNMVVHIKLRKPKSGSNTHTGTVMKTLHGGTAVTGCNTSTASGATDSISTLHLSEAGFPSGSNPVSEQLSTVALQKEDGYADQWQLDTVFEEETPTAMSHSEFVFRNNHDAGALALTRQPFIRDSGIVANSSNSLYSRECWSPLESGTLDGGSGSGPTKVLTIHRTRSGVSSLTGGFGERYMNSSGLASGDNNSPSVYYIDHAGLTASLDTPLRICTCFGCENDSISQDPKASSGIAADGKAIRPAGAAVASDANPTDEQRQTLSSIVDLHHSNVAVRIQPAFDEELNDFTIPNASDRALLGSASLRNNMPKASSIPAMRVPSSSGIAGSSSDDADFFSHLQSYATALANFVHSNVENANRMMHLLSLSEDDIQGVLHALEKS